MATTYTTNYHLGKQTDHADKFDMDVITDNMDIIDSKLYELETGKAEADDEAEDRAALVELVDNGAKNLLNTYSINDGERYGITYTINADGSISTTAGTATQNSNITVDFTLPAGAYYLSGCPDGGNTETPFNFNSSIINAVSGDLICRVYNSTMRETFTLTESTAVTWRFRVYNGQSIGATTFYPMVCSKADWDISQTYQPYRKDLAELTVDSDEDRAALVELVDNGAKNVLDLTMATEVVKADELSYTLAADGTLTVTWTADLSSSGKTINFKGFPYKAGTYILSGAQLDGSSTSVRADVREGSTAVVMDYGQPPTPFELPSNGYNYVIRVQAPAGLATFKPMICTEAAWNISHEYQPYRPSYQELYERVVALENA